jgi:hypothetical protein
MTARDRAAWIIIFLTIALCGSYLVLMIGTARISAAKDALNASILDENSAKIAVLKLQNRRNSNDNLKDSLAGIDLNSDLSSVGNKFVSYFRELAAHDHVGFSQIQFTSTPTGNKALMTDKAAHLTVGQAVFNLQGKFHDLLELTQNITQGPVLSEVPPDGVALSRASSDDASRDPILTEKLTVNFYGVASPQASPSAAPIAPATAPTAAAGVPGSGMITPAPVVTAAPIPDPWRQE